MDLKALKIGQSVVAGSEDLQIYDDEWHKVQEGGKTEYPSVNKLIEKFSKDPKHNVGNELDKQALTEISHELQKQIFGKIVERDPFSKGWVHVKGAAKNVFDAAAKSANSGHYLERLAGMCKAFGMKGTTEMVQAVAKYVLSSHKPQWIDGLMYDVSSSIIYRANELNPTPEDWAKIVWGLDHEALKENDLLKYRERNADPAKRENH